MKFKLIVDGSGVRQLNEAVLNEVLDNLRKGDEDSFVLLEPKEPIDGNVYLQVMYDVSSSMYSIETRFIFSSDKDFKHYSTSTSELSKVKEFFLNYFQGKLPLVKHWVNQAENEDENSELRDDVCKLYKKENDELFYFEFWIENEDRLIIHEGKLGEVGETRTINSDTSSLPLGVQLTQLRKDALRDGFYSIDVFSELIVQYVLKDGELDESAEIQSDLEDLMDDTLGWTGLGHCEGSDIEVNIINLFCNVIDKDIALKVFYEVFQDNDLLSSVNIVYANEKTGEFEQLYPSR